MLVSLLFKNMLKVLWFSKQFLLWGINNISIKSNIKYVCKQSIKQNIKQNKGQLKGYGVKNWSNCLNSKAVERTVIVVFQDSGWNVVHMVRVVLCRRAETSISLFLQHAHAVRPTCLLTLGLGLFFDLYLPPL